MAHQQADESFRVIHDTGQATLFGGYHKYVNAKNQSVRRAHFLIIHQNISFTTFS